MKLEEIKSILSECYQIGYMEAIKYYEPAQDYIKVSEVKQWLKMMKIEYKRFEILVDKKLIKSFRKGVCRNSPLYYSKAEIKRALSLVNASGIITNDIIDNLKKYNYENQTFKCR